MQDCVSSFPPARPLQVTRSSTRGWLQGLLRVGDSDPEIAYVPKVAAHVAGKPFRKALLAIMRVFWLYTARSGVFAAAELESSRANSA